MITKNGRMALAVCITCFATGWAAQGWRMGAAMAQQEQRYLQDMAQHQAQALQDYKAMEAAKDDAIKRYQEQARRDAADADNSRDAAERLRRDIANVPERIHAATRAAVDEYAATAGKLLGECSAQYQRMAEVADRHRINERLLMDAWPAGR